MYQVVLQVVLLTVVTLIPGESHKVKTQILVPKGMPIELEIFPGESTAGGQSFQIKRTTPDGGRAMLVILMIDKNKKLLPVLRLMSRDASKPTTVTPQAVNIAKIIVIVEWLETTSGKWVLDSPDPKVPIEAVIRRGPKALPKARRV
jgi:hypothetical protein